MPTYDVVVKQTRVAYTSVRVEARSESAARRQFFRMYHKPRYEDNDIDWMTCDYKRPQVIQVETVTQEASNANEKENT